VLIAQRLNPVSSFLQDVEGVAAVHQLPGFLIPPDQWKSGGRRMHSCLLSKRNYYQYTYRDKKKSIQDGHKIATPGMLSVLIFVRFHAC
jgi:hypothetical protein